MDQTEIEEIVARLRSLRDTGKTASEMTPELIDCIVGLAKEFMNYQLEHP